MDPDKEGIDEGDLDIKPAQERPSDGDLGKCVSMGDKGGELEDQLFEVPLFKHKLLSEGDADTSGLVSVGVPSP